jgi:hypothetical protein
MREEPDARRLLCLTTASKTVLTTALAEHLTRRSPTDRIHHWNALGR